MRLYEKVSVEAPPDTVWPHIADPNLRAAWHPQIVLANRRQSGSLMRGEKMEMIYHIEGKEHPLTVEVVESDPPNRLVLRHEVTRGEKTSLFDEVYTLKAVGRSTVVTQKVDLRGVFFLLRPLIWFVARFGKSTDAQYLERMAQIVEGRAG